MEANTKRKIHKGGKHEDEEFDQLKQDETSSETIDEEQIILMKDEISQSKEEESEGKDEQIAQLKEQVTELKKVMENKDLEIAVLKEKTGDVVTGMKENLETEDEEITQSKEPVDGQWASVNEDTTGISRDEFLQLKWKVGEITQLKEDFAAKFAELEECVKVQIEENAQLEECVKVQIEENAQLKECVKAKIVELAQLKEDIAEQKESLRVQIVENAQLKEGIQAINVELTQLKGNIDEIDLDMIQLKGNMEERDMEMVQMSAAISANCREIAQFNEIMPRFQLDLAVQGIGLRNQNDTLMMVERRLYLDTRELFKMMRNLGTDWDRRRRHSFNACLKIHGQLASGELRKLDICLQESLQCPYFDRRDCVYLPDVTGPYHLKASICQQGFGKLEAQLVGDDDLNGFMGVSTSNAQGEASDFSQNLTLTHGCRYWIEVRQLEGEAQLECCLFSGHVI